MSELITFGKYKGMSLLELVSYDIDYVNWLIKTKPKCMSEKHLNTLKELSMNKMRLTTIDSQLTSAYYNSPLYVELNNQLKNNLSNIDDEKYEDSIEYILQSIMYDKDENVYWYIPGKKYTYKSIADLDIRIIELYKLYKKQYNEDRNEKRPSKCITRYWRMLSEFCKISGETRHYESDSGKWMLFLNKSHEDENGYTELDRGWHIIVENAEHIFKYDGLRFDAKVSTCKPNSNANSTTDGVIILYCNQKYKTEMINRVRSIYKYDKPIYWKLDKLAGNVYAKDGIKVSSDVSYPI